MYKKKKKINQNIDWSKHCKHKKCMIFFFDNLKKMPIGTFCLLFIDRVNLSWCNPNVNRYQ